MSSDVLIRKHKVLALRDLEALAELELLLVNRWTVVLTFEVDGITVVLLEREEKPPLFDGNLN